MNWNTLLLFDFNNNKIDRKNSVQQAYNNEKQIPKIISTMTQFWPPPRTLH